MWHIFISNFLKLCYNLHFKNIIYDTCLKFRYVWIGNWNSYIDTQIGLVLAALPCNNSNVSINIHIPMDVECVPRYLGRFKTISRLFFDFFIM